MDKKEIKKSSYIYKLYRYRKDKLTEFLKKNGFLPKIFFSENDGEELPPFEMYYNEDKNRYEVFVRCKKTISNNMAELREFLLKTQILPFTLSSNITNHGYLDNFAFVILSDFSFSEFSFSNIVSNEEEETNLIKSYLKFMYEQFGEQYKKDYLKYIKKENKNELSK
ncbi:MAG: hypothetical protein J6T74_01055 [Clostridia bacterium]|nr:hypothetical protein [Clostridia bacterium]